MRILRDEFLTGRNTLGLAASAAALAEVDDDASLLDALEWARVQGLPVLPLGEGSNVVLAGDIEAMVLRQLGGGTDVLADDGERVVLRVAAGEDWHRFVGWTLQQGYFGLENLALIPGTVGAAPIQNIGAYGVELEQFVSAVHARELDSGEALALSPQDCRFAYRDSAFKGEWRDRLVITAVDLTLSRNPAVQANYPALAGELKARGLSRPTPQQVFAAVVAIRRRKLPDPAVEPNAGSFFKNPVIDPSAARELVERFPGLPSYPQQDGQVKLPAAWLIEQCGWKGYLGDGVGVHPAHALVLVNRGSDSGVRLLELAAAIKDSVVDCFGIELEIEPRIYGQRP